MMDITKKDIPHILQAIAMCSKSGMMQNHGAVVAIGSKMIGCGYNHYRTQFNNSYMSKNACSCHAEMHAIRNAISSSGKSSFKSSSKKRKKVGQRCKL
jgi:tRNA(Arg) A34 adenosine deaminase TadA